MSNDNDIEPLPDEPILLIHLEDIDRVKNGRWLSLNGDYFEVIEISEEPRDLYYQVHLKKLGGMPHNKAGYIGSFVRRDATLKFKSE